MIKNIYDRDNKQYRHEYFCDWCFKQIKEGEIFKSEFGSLCVRDLCEKCKKRRGE